MIWEFNDFQGGRAKKKDVKICEANPIHRTINRHNRLHDFSTPKEGEILCFIGDSNLFWITGSTILRVGKNPSHILMGRSGSAILIEAEPRRGRTTSLPDKSWNSGSAVSTKFRGWRTSSCANEKNSKIGNEAILSAHEDLD